MIAAQSIRMSKIQNPMSDSPRTDGNAEIIISDGCDQLDETGGEPPGLNVQLGRGSASMMASISKYDFSSRLELRRKAS